jgi:acetoacetyl-CoA synthetase
MTSNGKRQEIAVKKILNGARLEEVNADPKTLLWFMEHPSLKITAAPLKAKL